MKNLLEKRAILILKNPTIHIGKISNTHFSTQFERAIWIFLNETKYARKWWK